MNSWEELKALQMNQFRSTRRTDEEKFLALRQEEMAREYHRQFEALTSPLTNISNVVMEKDLVNGPQPDVKVEIRC